MKGSAILFMIFGVLVLLFGFYIYTGHGSDLVKPYNVKKSKSELRNIGKITMFTGVVIFAVFLTLFLIFA